MCTNTAGKYRQPPDFLHFDTPEDWKNYQQELEDATLKKWQTRYVEGAKTYPNKECYTEELALKIILIITMVGLLLASVALFACFPIIIPPLIN